MFLCRTAVPTPQFVLSCKPLFNFTVKKLKGKHAALLSVLNGQLLVSYHRLSELFIFSRQGRYLSTATTKYGDKLCDAAWTPCGNIVYTTINSNNVVIISASGKFITQTLMKTPWFISVSLNDIYFADRKEGVFHSTDDGFSWKLVFKPTDGWSCWQAIKVTTEHYDDFWTLEEKGTDRHLRVYSVDKRVCENNVTWRDIDVNEKSGKRINLLFSRLEYDGNTNIFLSDYNQAVHVFSTNGQYQCQLLSPDYIKNVPCVMAVDKERHLLFVGQRYSFIEVFKLM